MVEVTRIKVLRNGSGAVAVLPVSIEVDDIEKFRDELIVILDWKENEKTIRYKTDLRQIKELSV